MENLLQKDWAEEAFEKPENVIIDVRTPGEFESGMISGAFNIDIYNYEYFISEIEKLDRSRHYFIYCRSGGRSRKACEIMDNMGFEHTCNLIGGIMKWEGEIVDPDSEDR